LRHRLTHRRAADAEILRQLALVEPDLVTAMVDVHRHDGVLQRGVGLLLETRAGIDRLQCRVRATCIRPGRCAITGLTVAAAVIAISDAHAGIQYASGPSASNPPPIKSSELLAELVHRSVESY